MNNRFKKLVGFAAAALMIATFTLSAAAYSTDNDYYFSLNMASNQGHSCTSESYYRGTASTATPWMVNLSATSEGTGTKAEFFICTKGFLGIIDKKSDYKLTQQGKGNQYYRAYDEANGVDLHLGVRNNNNVSSSYSVSGYWDEETAKHTFND